MQQFQYGFSLMFYLHVALPTQACIFHFVETEFVDYALPISVKVHDLLVLFQYQGVLVHL